MPASTTRRPGTPYTLIGTIETPEGCDLPRAVVYGHDASGQAHEVYRSGYTNRAAEAMKMYAQLTSDKDRARYLVIFQESTETEPTADEIRATVAAVMPDSDEARAMLERLYPAPVLHFGQPVTFVNEFGVLQGGIVAETYTGILTGQPRARITDNRNEAADPGAGVWKQVADLTPIR